MAGVEPGLRAARGASGIASGRGDADDVEAERPGALDEGAAFERRSPSQKSRSA